MKQRKVSVKQRGSIAFWAWSVSIVLHVIVLSIFGVVRFSRFKPELTKGGVPTAKVSRITELLRTSTVIPKPKVIKPVTRQFAEKTNALSSAEELLSLPGPVPEGSANLQNSPASKDFSLPSDSVLSDKTEFFGSWTSRRKICYVVDCSGSMKGIFGRVRRRLRQSIEALEQDQFFNIIFFGNNRLYEFSEHRLVRATGKSKSRAYDFIDSVSPAGKTNAMAALQRVLQNSNSSDHSPSIIYFLTDGFELTAGDTRSFSRKTAQLLKDYAPMTNVNTIGFWPQENDRKILEIIASQSGGECVLITE